MNRLHLLIPDLFPPREIAAEVGAGLRLSALEKLLGRGKSSLSGVSCLEDWLCAAFGGQAIAPVRAVSDGLAGSEGYWLCADPVCLQLQRAQMMVLPAPMISLEECHALCGVLNEHFAGTGMTFFAPHPRRWYLRLEMEPQITTFPLQQVAWSDAKHHQPRGADALHWQRIVTEVQMLLYAHPLNRAREARGESLVSSLWLWGGRIRNASEQALRCGRWRQRAGQCVCAGCRCAAERNLAGNAGCRIRTWTVGLRSAARGVAARRPSRMARVG